MTFELFSKPGFIFLFFFFFFTFVVSYLHRVVVIISDVEHCPGQRAIICYPVFTRLLGLHGVKFDSSSIKVDPSSAMM